MIQLIFSKRQKFIFSSAALSVGLWVVQAVALEYRYVAVLAFFLVTYLVSAWALIDDLKGVEWLTILILPAMYSGAIALFSNVLLQAPLVRLVMLTIFGIGMYAVYLTENIYSVAANRTIQLLRAAHAVGFFMSIFVLVLLYNTVFSLHLAYWVNGLTVFLVSFPVLVQGLWSVRLMKKLDSLVLWMAFGVAMSLGMLGMMLSFLPVTVWIAALFLATVVYVGMGLLQHMLNERLFIRTMYEYLSVGIFVLVATLLVTPWR